ncbi:hypothetical protein Tco_0509919, partial [Tanacetum coccineum]
MKVLKSKMKVLKRTLKVLKSKMKVLKRTLKVLKSIRKVLKKKFLMGIRKVLTEEQVESTDGHKKGTEEEIAAQATQTSTQTPTSNIFGDDETIAK